MFCTFIIVNDKDAMLLFWLLHSLVVCNLYPFSQTVSAGNVIADEAVEQIDIGIASQVISSAVNKEVNF